MANMTRFDPFNDLVDDLFKGYVVPPTFPGYARKTSRWRSMVRR